jgi:hypothetical protein
MVKVPEYTGKDLSVINRLTTPDAPRQVWLWSNSNRYNVYPDTPENRTHLTTEGYQCVPRADSERLAIASTQITDAAYLIDQEQGTANLWMLADAIAHAWKYPASLAFSLDLATKSNIIPMLQFLPFPQIGEFGLVHEDGAAITLYEITALPERSRLLWQAMSEKIRGLALPGAWFEHCVMYRRAMDEDRYQAFLADIRANEPTRTRNTVLKRVEETHEQLQLVRQSWLQDNWLERWEEITKMAQELTVDYYEHHLAATQKPHIDALPSVVSSSSVVVPSCNGMRGLVQSFGPGIQPGLWNEETSLEQMLITPNNTTLRVRGKNDGERFALARYISEEIGVEGLKHLAGILHAYYSITRGASVRKEDAVISLRGLLVALNYGSHAEEKEEQRKLMNTLLYLSRTWISSSEVEYSTRGRNKGKIIKEYTPLLVMEALKINEIDGIDLPEAIEFHLGKEFYDLLFGSKQQYFTLPAMPLLSYHAVREQQEICLAFYLTNMLAVNAGKSARVSFPLLLENSALSSREELEKGHDRLRDAMRALYALEHLQRDGWLIRAAHSDIDIALAAEWYLQPGEAAMLAPETYTRITTTYASLRAENAGTLKRLRRVALQKLLNGNSEAIDFKPGALIKKQAEMIEEGRRRAIARNEDAMTARAIKAARGTIKRDLAAPNKGKK